MLFALVLAGLDSEPAYAQNGGSSAATSEATAAAVPLNPSNGDASTLETPAPILVAVLAVGSVPAEIIEASRAAVIAHVAPMTGGRPVLPLLADSLRDAIAACAEPSCIGGHIASAGAFGAILVRLSRARGPRAPIQMSLEMLDPVSGAPRLPAMTAVLTDAASTASVLEPITARLRDVMFSPPLPPPTLLVTVNVDGARVRVGDLDLGDSPVARATLRRGRHVVTVTRDGYVSARRTIDLDDGQNERLDVVLVPSTVTSGDETSPSGASGTARSAEMYEEPWFWGVLGGGVVVVGVAIALGVGLASSSGPPPMPMGIRLPPID